jgi:hypothetical protein
MSTKKWRNLTLLLFLGGLVLPVSYGKEPSDPWRSLHELKRQIPDSDDHPGNVFLENETVMLPISTSEGIVAWRATDDRRRLVVEGNVESNIDDSDQHTIHLGKLGIGWYRITWLDAKGDSVDWTTAAVIARLASPVPQDSPICIDSATSWFARDDQAMQKDYSQLAALAGVNWIRDRIRRRDFQPESEQFLDETQYDHSAKIQSQHGLKILQVHHDTPLWAATGGGGTGRFPGDLRVAYQFGKAMSKRFKKTVLAWEPWNEANVANFGSHTMDEICSLQKAAYLGYKAGNPEATVCWNVTTAVPTERQTECVLLNETWPYFNTYNIHTYDWPDSYQRLWKPVLKAACGKPLWITESDRGISSDSNSPTQDLSPENEILKAQFIAQSYASSLQAGANRHFHFVLGQYSERATQFGLLRHDLTPRPSYVALAATGRLLAGARCLGKLANDGQPNVHVIAFRGSPDGKSRDVLVAWAERQVDWPERGKYEADWPIAESVSVEACFDYLGRSIADGLPSKLSSAPIFAILPEGECDQLTLHLPPKSAPRPGTPSSIVLQCLMPRETSRQDKSIRWASQFEHTINPDVETEVPLYVYNFSDHEVTGNISIEEASPNCQMQLAPLEVRLAPMARKKLTARVKIAESTEDASASNWNKLRGEFGNAGRPVLTFRLVSSSKLPQ